VFFGLLTLLFTLVTLPFSLLALIPLKQFQQDREYIDYQRRIELLPALRKSGLHDLTLQGRLPLSAWFALVFGSLIVIAGFMVPDKNLSVAAWVMGFLMFGIGLFNFNRTNIAIRGERIIIERTGIGGSLRRSNFAVIHRIEVTKVEQKHGSVRICYAFVGTGIEREVIYLGSKDTCSRLVDALTGHGADTEYDIAAISREQAQAHTQPQTQPAAPQAVEASMDQVAAPKTPPRADSAASSIGLRTLISAIRSNQIGLIKQLIEVGVDVNARDVTGRTPLQFAHMTGNEQIIHMLRQAGAE
jgi:hypothetical protein